MARNRIAKQSHARSDLHTAGRSAASHLSPTRKSRRAAATGGDKKSEGKIVRYTASQIKEMIARGEDQTDWERIRKMTEADIQAAIDSDPDWRDIPRDWYKNAIPAPAKDE